VAAAAEVVAAATAAVALTTSLCGRTKSGAGRRAQKVVRAMRQLTVAATAGEAMPAMAAASDESNAVVVPPLTAVSTARGLPRQRVADGVRHRSHRRPRQVLRGGGGGCGHVRLDDDGQVGRRRTPRPRPAAVPTLCRSSPHYPLTAT